MSAIWTVRHGDSRPVKQFDYMPIRRRLIHLYESKKMAKAMRYRAVEHEEHWEEGKMMDIFDGSHYRHLGYIHHRARWFPPQIF